MSTLSMKSFIASVFSLALTGTALLNASPAAAAGCPVGGSEHSFGTGLGCAQALSRPESKRVMEILNDAGVTPDHPHVMGAWTLNVERIDCSRVVYPGAVPSCTLTKNGFPIEVAVGDANYLFNMLLRREAYEYAPGCIFGGVNVMAFEVSCTRIVVPGARARCSLVTPMPIACTH